MTIHTGSIEQKRVALAALPGVAAAAARRLDAERRSALEYEDPNLSAAGNAAEARARSEAVQSLAAITVAEQRRQADDAALYLEQTLSRERPQITDYARAQASWGQARMYLDKGHTLLHVLRNADQALTLAVEEFGPHWLRSQRDPSKVWELRYMHDATIDPTEAATIELQAAVMERLAATAADPALAGLIRASAETAPMIAATAPWWKALDAIAAGRTFSGLRAAAEARIADQRPLPMLSEESRLARRSA
ncbi:MAG: hypothetical protein ACQEW8_04485 [Actinomycetota bacterium]